MRITVTKRYSTGQHEVSTTVDVESAPGEVDINEAITDILDALEYRERVNSDN